MNKIEVKNLKIKYFEFIFLCIWAQLKSDLLQLEAICMKWGQLSKTILVSFKSLCVKVQMSAN